MKVILCCCYSWNSLSFEYMIVPARGCSFYCCSSHYPANQHIHRYEGTFLEDQRNGRGVCKYASGAEYNKSWRVDVPNGYGSYVGPGLDEYHRKWVGGKRCGKGGWRSAHGHEWHEGIWDNNVPHGPGRRMFADGTR